VRLTAKSPRDDEIELCERFAEGFASRLELTSAGSQIGGMGAFSAASSANDLRAAILEEIEGDAAQRSAQCAAGFAFNTVYESTMIDYVGDRGKSRTAHAAECKALATALREIVGNPFRPVAIDPDLLTWHDGIIVEIAQRIYEHRAFADLPILADALEEAGCANAELLVHCRSDGSHVRGCWTVDLLLGKT
jgi:hypothetical protein